MLKKPEVKGVDFWSLNLVYWVTRLLTLGSWTTPDLPEVKQGVFLRSVPVDIRSVFVLVG